MASCVFLRAANVGGTKVFRPAALAKELAHLDVINVGAAGTFAVRGRIGQRELREEIAARLPFETEIVICSARTLADLVAAEPFPSGARAQDLKRAVSVLARRPSRLPALPVARPETGPWEACVVAVEGRFALSLRRPGGKPGLDVNALVESELGVPATTRTWNTMQKLVECLA